MRQARFKTKGTYDAPSGSFSIWPEGLYVSEEMGQVRLERDDGKFWIIKGTVDEATIEIDAALNWNSKQKYPDF